MKSTGAIHFRIVDGKRLDFFTYEYAENGKMYLAVYQGSRHAKDSVLIGFAVSDFAVEILLDQHVA